MWLFIYLFIYLFIHLFIIYLSIPYLFIYYSSVIYSFIYLGGRWGVGAEQWHEGGVLYTSTDFGRIMAW